MDGDFDPDRDASSLDLNTDYEPDLYYTPRDGHTIYLCHPAHPDGAGTYFVDDDGTDLGRGTWHADGGGLYFDTWEPAGGSGERRQ